MELMARKEEIRALANDDPAFAELLERYETLSRDTTACRLIGQLDDKTWEKDATRSCSYSMRSRGTSTMQDRNGADPSTSLPRFSP